jgi:hypothetical protein
MPCSLVDVYWYCTGAFCCKSLSFTFYSLSHMQICVKIWSSCFSNFKIIFHFTCFNRCGHHWVLWKLPLKTVVLVSVNTIPKHTFIYVPVCCASVTCSGNCVSISCMEYTMLNRGCWRLIKASDLKEESNTIYFISSVFCNIYFPSHIYRLQNS